MSRHPEPYRDGRVHVLAERCDTCVFRPGNRMHLEAGRVKELLEDNLGLDSALQCHKTLPYAPNPWPGAVCRGFYDHPRSGESLPLRLARILGTVTFDPLPDKENR